MSKRGTDSHDPPHGKGGSKPAAGAGSSEAGAGDLRRLLEFMLEMDKLKNVHRRSKPMGLTRYENSAEHSWQVALMALVCRDHADFEVDVARAVQMLIVHDIVEIDAGDKMIYSQAYSDFENESKAARRLFGMLPADRGKECMDLWLEYEAKETPEAKYAYAMDRAMPLLQNLHNGGVTWVENGISYEQVVEKNRPIAQASRELWALLERMLDEAVEQGILKRRGS